MCTVFSFSAAVILVLLRRIARDWVWTVGKSVIPFLFSATDFMPIGESRFPSIQFLRSSLCPASLPRCNRPPPYKLSSLIELHPLLRNLYYKTTSWNLLVFSNEICFLSPYEWFTTPANWKRAFAQPINGTVRSFRHSSLPSQNRNISWQSPPETNPMEYVLFSEKECLVAQSCPKLLVPSGTNTRIKSLATCRALTKS